MHNPYLVPVSIKGVLIEDDKVWLRKNERGEWELPGGKLDEGEQPEETLVRELSEELGLQTEAVEILHVFLYRIEKSTDEKKGVLVVSYLCKIIEKAGEFELKGEAGEAKFAKFTLEEVKTLKMPKFYKEVILNAFSL